MARKRPAPDPNNPVKDYRHPKKKRKNNPPAKIAAEGTVPVVPAVVYDFSPRLPPTLRFDSSGRADHLPPILEKARKSKLSSDEVEALAAALRAVEQPWLEWSGKRERPAFAVDPVALHRHEHVSTQAIIAAVRRQDVERSLFGDPELEYREAVQFYRHDIDWSNRLILGDSLQVMASLAQREDLAGKVQMIYIDPPYGIKFRSNFQSQIDNKDVKDRESDLTREPEMVRAFRDTWHLGVHSYLAYLRDRLITAKELLHDSGSIFLQIGDENLHRVRSVMDEVLGVENYVVTIVARKKSTSTIGQSINDYVLWYAKDKAQIKQELLKQPKRFGDDESRFSKIELLTGEQIPLDFLGGVPQTGRYLNDDYPIDSQDISSTRSVPFILQGAPVHPGRNRHWTFDPLAGMTRLQLAERLRPTQGQSARGIIYWDDDNHFPINNLWDDVLGERNPVYVVQTNRRIIERCMLMTTDPGDLVLDPTCGSGTTAFVAEQWGRRWITIDTSRVAVAIARQRLLTSKFDFYKLKDADGDVGEGFIYKRVPHITLKSIAQNQNLDPIFAKHEPILDKQLALCNKALGSTKDDLRFQLLAKLHAKEKAQGKKSITDADRRRWELPKKGETWQHWQVPFDTDPDWPKPLQEAVTAYRTAWRAKMDAVNQCIADNAEYEELVNQPEKDNSKIRVSGPFTVEAVQPPEMSLSDVVGFAHPPGDLDETFAVREVKPGLDTANVEAYLDRMVRLLRGDGMRFPNNKSNQFTRLEPIYATGQADGFHAEGRWVPAGETDPDPDGGSTVGVVFGPQYGPVTVKMIEELIKPASRRYDHLVIAGFSFTAEAQAIIDENAHPKLRIHMAHIRPDANPAMADLLKDQPGSQLFTVFGQPRTVVHGAEDGHFVVEMEGVDIYNPVDNSITPTKADKVAAWFLDSNYDGQTFCITQAFFPDRTAWDKLTRALGDKGLIDEERFAAFSGTVSLPFKPGDHRKVAIKVIDPRGNEVMRVHDLPNGKRGKK